MEGIQSQWKECMDEYMQAVQDAEQQSHLHHVISKQQEELKTLQQELHTMQLAQESSSMNYEEILTALQVHNETENLEKRRLQHECDWLQGKFDTKFSDGSVEEKLTQMEALKTTLQTSPSKTNDMIIVSFLYCVYMMELMLV
jgi:hypothetical protein